MAYVRTKQYNGETIITKVEMNIIPWDRANREDVHLVTVGIVGVVGNYDKRSCDDTELESAILAAEKVVMDIIDNKGGSLVGRRMADLGFRLVEQK